MTPKKKVQKLAGVPKATKTALRVERAQVAVAHAGSHFGYKHHIFIAKLKRGEVWALNQLKYETKVGVTPLFEMWPPNPARPSKPAKTLPQHLADLMSLIATEWTGLPCFVDSLYLQAGGEPSPNSAQTVFDVARAEGVHAVPVTSPYFAQEFQTVISNVIATDGRGVMFRLPVSFFNSPQHVAGYLDGLAAVLRVQRSDVDILIDLAHRPNLVEVEQLGIHCLQSLPNAADWRTVTLAAGCFPDSISAEPVSQWIPFDRSDWNGWSAVVAQRTSANLRRPSYGDYGVRCGGPPVFIPNTPAPNIRYTVPTKIWVRKGLKVEGSARAICADLVTQAHFSGPTFSQGDADIQAKAATTNPANGSPEQWIQWCTNHHIEMTASQIQNLP